MSSHFSASFMPSFVEYEAVIGKAIGEHVPLTASFVFKLFDKARRQRINAKLEPIATEAITEAANSFATTYHANVKIEPPHERASLLSVVESIRFRAIPRIALEVADELIKVRLIELREQSVGTIAEGLFVMNNEESAIEQARRWLDYGEISKDSVVHTHFIGLIRELTILCRTYDLLDGLILRQEAGCAG